MSAHSLFWPGDHRAGDVFSPEAYAGALVAVEVAWLRVLGRVGTGTGGRGRCTGRGLAGSDELVGSRRMPRAAATRSSRCWRCCAPRLPDEGAKWLHKGLTSQDVVDTALMLCARSAFDRHADDLGRCVAALAELAHSTGERSWSAGPSPSTPCRSPSGSRRRGGWTGCWTRWTGL